MPIFYGKVALKSFLKTFENKKTSIGFVPTMGALHQGHLSLMQQSLLENQCTVVSIFVNPTQFNKPEDLLKYPRTLDKDCQKINNLNPNIIIYAPTVVDIYDTKIESEHFDFDGLENQMEGQFRPGHFDGVGTIVKCLFEIVTPTNAYFGEKDFQQLQIIKKLTAKLKLPIKIIGCPIFREKNGLAMSSRNERLTPLQRDQAHIIFETLQQAKTLFETKSAAETTQWVQTVFDKNELFELEYFQIANEETLEPCLQKSSGQNYRIKD